MDSLARDAIQERPVCCSALGNWPSTNSSERFLVKNTTPAPAQPRRVKLPAAAKYAGLSTKTLRRRIADGSLPGFRLGARTIVVDLNDVDALFCPIPTVTAVS
jgi:predicted DNA-binding transcriptional regulator AlpA